LFLLDDYLIHYCAPALAGLKPANLFSWPYHPGENMSEALNTANSALNSKGVFLEALRNGRLSILVLVYRKTHLEALLNNEKAAGILRDKGYPVGSVADCIDFLKSRISAGSFPHEIGILLGYPPEDVAGFILNGGKGGRCGGCWKVYSDAADAERLFAAYRNTTGTFIKRHLNGASVAQLTVPS
jgi:hypothetical protein